jgi:hypothetical protein
VVRPARRPIPPRDRARHVAFNPRACASGALTAPRAGANPSRGARARGRKNRTTATLTAKTTCSSSQPPRENNKTQQRPVASAFGSSSNNNGDSGGFDGFGPLGGGGSGGGANNPANPLPYEAQETILFFCADGSVSRVPGRRRVVLRPPPSALDLEGADLDAAAAGLYLSPSAPAAARAQAGGHLPMPAPSQQSLCVASTFSLQATNGRDPSRRISFEGFVQLPEVLEEAVEASVLSRGGEVLVRQRDFSPEALASRLAMRVAVPLLFGVPEEWVALRETIESAGGIVHHIQRSWLIGGSGGGGGGGGGGGAFSASRAMRG